MKNKITALLLILALCFSLCGCRLALPDGEDTQRDRLIGCFITTEYLDLFDFEAYINDNAAQLLKGDNIISSSDSDKYSGRIYAELYKEEFKDSEGVSHYTYNYRFPSLEGIAYFAPTINEGDDMEYVTFQTGEGLNDVKNHLKSHNEDTYYTELSATVYAPVDENAEFEGSEIAFYMNPVYQSADGEVYLVSGSGTAMNCTAAGMIMSKKLSEEYSVTINGEEKKGGGSVEISYYTAYIPELLRIIEMDAEGNVLKINELIPGALPESYMPQTETAYIISESVSVDTEGREFVERSIIEPDGDSSDIFSLVVGEGGWLVNEYCSVLWE